MANVVVKQLRPSSKDPLGSGCGSVGRAVASNARGPRFESSHWQPFISDICLFTVNCIEKTKINEKRPGMADFFKKKKGPLRHALFVSYFIFVFPLWHVTLLLHQIVLQYWSLDLWRLSPKIFEWLIFLSLTSPLAIVWCLLSTISLNKASNSHCERCEASANY